MKAIYLTNRADVIEHVYGPEQQARLASSLGETPPIVLPQMLASGAYAGVEMAFSTWGMPALDAEAIETGLPGLRTLYYAAGSVQGFARPFLTRGVRVFSGWHANAVPVAQFSFAQILLAAKGTLPVQAAMRREGRAKARALFETYPGNYGIRVGLLGCGAIGSLVAEMLKGSGDEVLAFDPFLSEARARQLGVRLTSLEEIFETCLVISNHLANLPATQGILTRAHLLSMLPQATFINTGRGAQLDERDLYDALTLEPGRTAVLDVLTDEAQSDRNPLAGLPNCFLTPHIAGACGQERWRMADYMIDAYLQGTRGEPSLYEVTLPMLETMA